MAHLELDPATAALVEELATTWRVSRVEAVRRAVAEGKVVNASSNSAQRLESFRELQRRLQVTSESAAAWQQTIREGRR